MAKGTRTSRCTVSTSPCPKAACSGSSGRTGRGRRRRSAACSAWSPRPPGARRVLGQPTPAGLPAVMRRVGAIVETPAMFPTMTARENLALLGAIDGIGPRRVEASLSTVGLAERADEKVAKYSLGMRQRLGLAGALAEGPGAARARRAGQRPRPGRHPRDPRAAARPRRRGAHRVRVQPPAQRGRADLRPGRDHRPWTPRAQRAGRRRARRGRPPVAARRAGRHRRRPPTCCGGPASTSIQPAPCCGWRCHRPRRPT